MDNVVTEQAGAKGRWKRKVSALPVSLVTFLGFWSGSHLVRKDGEEGKHGLKQPACPFCKQKGQGEED